jgi:hypothetical protein
MKQPNRRLLAVTGAGSLLFAAGAALTPGVSSASSHREAPLVAGDPRADNTDVYAFVSPDKPDTVTLISNWIPFEEPNGGPNFYPFAENAHYNIKIDNNGDGAADTTYTWTFTNHVRDAAGQFLYNTGVVKNLSDATLNFYQTYTLTQTSHGNTTTLLKNKKVAPSDVGPASMPNYKRLRHEAVNQGQLANGGQTYVGQADDPFFVDLRVFDLLYGGNLSETGQDTLDGYNVNTIALQLPKSALALNHKPGRNPVIGVWSTTDRAATTTFTSSGAPNVSGKYVQVSRLGNPLVNEAVVPLKYKDAFNALHPAADHTVTPVVNKVKDPIVPKLIESIYGIPAPATPRNDLVEIFLTGICKACGPINADLNSQLLNKGVTPSKFVPAEELRLNMSIAPNPTPNRLGVLGNDLQGYPNGRRLGDDVVDIELQALEGAAQTGTPVPALANGDGVDSNDVAFGTTFPYVALPHDTAVDQPDGASSAAGVTSSSVGGGSSDGGTPALPVGLAISGIAIAGIGISLMARRRPVVA